MNFRKLFGIKTQKQKAFKFSGAGAACIDPKCSIAPKSFPRGHFGRQRTPHASHGSGHPWILWARRRRKHLRRRHSTRPRTSARSGNLARQSALGSLPGALAAEEPRRRGSQRQGGGGRGEVRGRREGCGDRAVGSRAAGENPARAAPDGAVRAAERAGEGPERDPGLPQTPEGRAGSRCPAYLLLTVCL